jgi:hypothetical protein
VVSSIQTLKERGHFEQYKRILSPAHTDAILLAVAGMWLPMPVARAHYEACDRLRLTNEERREMGARSGERAQGTVLKTAAAIARRAGASPWSFVPLLTRLWARGADGGGIAVYKAGPKYSIVEVVGCELFGVNYFRAAFTGVVIGIIKLAATNVYAQDLPAPAPDGWIGRFQWA